VLVVTLASDWGVGLAGILRPPWLSGCLRPANWDSVRWEMRPNNCCYPWILVTWVFVKFCIVGL